MSDTETFRITDVEQLQQPEIQKYLLKFFSTNKLVKDPVAAYMELAARISIEQLGMFLARDEGELQGAMLAQLNNTPLNPGCTVIHLMVDKPSVRNDLMRELIDYARSGGHDRIVAIDANNRGKAFARLFSVVGEPEELGSVFTFDLDGGLL